VKKIAALLLISCVPLLVCAEPTAGPWQGRKAAIALTYDDALKSQLDIAIPQLNDAGLKGTFFLTGRNVNTEVERWRAAAASGHELANHTVNHPCERGTYEMPAQYTSEAYSVEVFLTEVGTMNALLQALDRKQAHSFAPPCGHRFAGGKDYFAPLQQARLASYIRDGLTMPKSVAYIGFDNKSGAEMIAWVQDVARKGGAGVIVFHGVGGDYLNVSAAAHRELVQYLKAREHEIFTASFSDVMAGAAQ
jgi:peptidoglycan/xylan/chitin deacetylase (PgdA/CDA1 family)